MELIIGYEFVFVIFSRPILFQQNMNEIPISHLTNDSDGERLVDIVFLLSFHHIFVLVIFDA